MIFWSHFFKWVAPAHFTNEYRELRAWTEAGKS
jgi:hypothetical protein